MGVLNNSRKIPREELLDVQSLIPSITALVDVASQDWHLLLCPLFLGALMLILGFSSHNPTGIRGFFVETDGILQIRVVQPVSPNGNNYLERLPWALIKQSAGTTSLLKVRC